MATGPTLLLILLLLVGVLLVAAVAVLLVWLYTRKRPEQRGFEIGPGSGPDMAGLADASEEPRTTQT